MQGEAKTPQPADIAAPGDATPCTHRADPSNGRVALPLLLWRRGSGRGGPLPLPTLRRGGGGHVPLSGGPGARGGGSPPPPWGGEGGGGGPHYHSRRCGSW